MELLVIYTRFTEPLPDGRYQELARFLNTEDRDKNQRYRRWQDRHAHLFGRLLLRKAYAELDGGADFYHGLEMGTHGKPRYANGFDFNIAHSGSYVVCAVSQQGICGVDVEAVKPIDLHLMDRYFTPAEWRDISAQPIPRFYHYWTRKEAVIKANGKGLSLPLVEVDCQANEVTVDGATWHVAAIDLEPDHLAHAATGSPVETMTVMEVAPESFF